MKDIEKVVQKAKEPFEKAVSSTKKTFKENK